MLRNNKMQKSRDCCRRRGRYSMCGGDGSFLSVTVTNSLARKFKVIVVLQAGHNNCCRGNSITRILYECVGMKIKAVTFHSINTQVEVTKQHGWVQELASPVECSDESQTSRHVTPERINVSESMVTCLRLSLASNGHDRLRENL